eukprot:SAG11_NODE_652_length_7925_cov_3.950166_2_plen_61_part_00
MTTRTKDRFPQADVLANYLREFGRGQVQPADKIRRAMGVARPHVVLGACVGTISDRWGAS